MSINKDFNKKVLDKLDELGASKSCHRCGHDKQEFVGYGRQEIGESPVTLGNGMPVVITACQNCAVVSYHALMPLGLTHPEEK